ncbi:GH39 family glycosyl hydrolase [uncultured Cellulomonas sp.]|uniref:GH39 family glycosyl hydrolase n=1 Tax=uncultured Cellulomonas sp. TaxID=189682 RepID=UPI00261400E9|nr:xylan 1,4-beta-xylosidase [uncultured Cellulomonas sp.]
MAVVVPSEPIGRLTDAWRACVGTGRASLALRGDYVESLTRTQRDIGFRAVRGHGLLSDDMGVHRPYTLDGERRVRHSFTYVDQVVDTYLAQGIRPFLELGFMPSGLASGGQTVFWWNGNVTPPSSYPEWAELVAATLRHLVDRYGIEEVRSWPVEVWNEPNLTNFWAGADRDEYLRLYEVTARAVKDVDSGLQVGGPAISPGADEWWEPFAEFVTARDVPCDFVSRHAYTSGPAQHVPFGTYQDMQPPQALLDQFGAARRHLAGSPLAELPVHITEFNTSYRPDNPVHDTADNAAYLAPVLAAGGDLVDSFSYWTFCDVFEEEGVPTSLFHGGFGLLTHRGIAKPTFHLYAFMARMGATVLARGDDHLVTRHKDGRVTVLAWQPVDGSATTAATSHTVRLSVPVAAAARPWAAPPPDGDHDGGPATVFALRHRVNESDGNAWTAWQGLGRPASPSARHLDVLHEASRPAVEHRALPLARGRVELDLHLAQHEVTLVELEVVRDGTAPWTDDTRIPGYHP